MAAIYNFPEIKETNTFRQRTIQIIKNNVPLDITGGTVLMQLRKQTNSTVLHVFETSITNGLNGELTLMAWNVDLPPGEYQYDLRITDFSGTILTYIKGVMRVTSAISK